MAETESRLISICKENACPDPIRLFRIMIRSDDVPMHGPIHHSIVPLALVAAAWSLSKDFDLDSYLNEVVSRSSEVPAAICGLWGSCGSAIGVGIFESVMSRTGPLSKGKRWGNCNRATADALGAIAAVGGPRCCKRNAVLSLLSACGSAKRDLGIEMTPSIFSCTRFRNTEECIGSKCPFFSAKNIPNDDD